MTRSTADGQRQTLQELADDFERADRLFNEIECAYAWFTAERKKIRLSTSQTKASGGLYVLAGGSHYLAGERWEQREAETKQLTEQWERLVPILSRALRKWGLWREEFRGCLRSVPRRLEFGGLDKQQTRAVSLAVYDALQQGRAHALDALVPDLPPSVAAPAAPAAPVEPAPAEADSPVQEATPAGGGDSKQRKVLEAWAIVQREGWNKRGWKGFAERVDCDRRTLSKWAEKVKRQRDDLGRAARGLFSAEAHYGAVEPAGGSVREVPGVDLSRHASDAEPVEELAQEEKDRLIDDLAAATDAEEERDDRQFRQAVKQGKVKRRSNGSGVYAEAV